MCGQPLEIPSMDSFSESPKLADSRWNGHAYSWVRSLSANPRVTVDKRLQATCGDERGAIDLDRLQLAPLNQMINLRPADAQHLHGHRDTYAKRVNCDVSLPRRVRSTSPMCRVSDLSGCVSARSRGQCNIHRAPKQPVQGPIARFVATISARHGHLSDRIPLRRIAG